MKSGIKKEILIFPGAFNPPHCGHVAAVKNVLKRISFDEVWIMPSGKRPDKQIEISYEDRRNLCGILIGCLCEEVRTPVRLITAELDNKDGRDTREIIQKVKSEVDANVAQLIGLDGYMRLYKNSFREVERDNFLVVARAGYSLPADFCLPEKTTLLDTEADMISSTRVRDMVKVRDDSYKAIVPQEIATYIEERGLYL